MSDLPSRKTGAPEGSAVYPVANDDPLRHIVHELVHLFVQVLELARFPRCGPPRSRSRHTFCGGARCRAVLCVRPRPVSREERRRGAVGPRRAGGTS